MNDKNRSLERTLPRTVVSGQAVEWGSKVTTGRMLDTDTNPLSKAPVLLVEDDVLVRTMVSDELRANGISVIECGDADEALEILQSRTRIALVVTDIQMPGSMNGVGLASVIKREHPELKVIITSSERPPDGAKFDHFVAKPWDIPNVIRHIKLIVGA
ncbi:response regulator [Bradyrhizobium liaoningense]